MTALHTARKMPPFGDQSQDDQHQDSHQLETLSDSISSLDLNATGNTAPTDVIEVPQTARAYEMSVILCTGKWSVPQLLDSS